LAIGEGRSVMLSGGLCRVCGEPSFPGLT